ncbi:MAG: tyrosinase family protein [Ignavibacteriae bacterium]|nr:tyrosinase family protein [Ignavibacteriota bacterium]MCB9217353.1 tyrosinase family protein [Ignavibacteria bacterium]
MTQSEKDELVAAFDELRDGPDLINDLASYHNNNFQAIHFNNTGYPRSWSNPNNDVFFAWHRRQIFELEQAMQDINPNLSIPFWDWTVDNSTSSALWDNDFLGQFNSAWSLGRSLGSTGSLPSSTNVATVQSITNWQSYVASVENGIVHSGGHIWVNGIMAAGNSPLDPVFYLHHGMLDKLWQDWEEANQASTFVKTSMPRYDGTYSFNGTTLPSVNPNDIVDAKSLGVFFAENGLAELEDYTVSNTYNTVENFYYQYTIEAGNDFIIPSGKKCKFESVNIIALNPGFTSSSGSEFTAKIDSDNDITTAAKPGVVAVRDRPAPEPSFPYFPELMSESPSIVTAFPNPFNEKIHLNLGEKPVSGQITIFDVSGRVVYEKKFSDASLQEITDLAILEPGLYVLKVYRENEATEYIKIMKQ